jgi:hypothetical protein
MVFLLWILTAAGNCEIHKFIEYSGNISGKSPPSRGGKTGEGRRDSFPSGFGGSGLAGTFGAAGFERTY